MAAMIKDKRPLVPKIASKVTFNWGGNSLFCLSNNNKLRLWAKSIVEWQYFETLIFFIIALNSVILMLEEPALVDPYSKSVINWLNKGINVLYLAEAVLKIVAMGFVLEKNSYLRDPFNVFDFVIIIVSIASMIIEDQQEKTEIDLNFITSFRALRSLRPLRMISSNDGMKLVVNSLFNSVPNLFNVLLVSLLFYYVFGILALQLLSGKLGYCEGDKTLNKVACLAAGYEWTQPSWNYNNIF